MKHTVELNNDEIHRIILDRLEADYNVPTTYWNAGTWHVPLVFTVVLDDKEYVVDQLKVHYDSTAQHKS